MKNNIRKKWLLIVSALIFGTLLPVQANVATIPGNHSVSASGAAVYSIPMPVVKGVSNLVPQISLTYNSQTGNGVAGYGFNLSGISMISLGGKSVYYDGIAAPVNLSQEPIYYLDGSRLLPTSGSSNSYSTEMETYNKITQLTSLDSRPYFEVKDRNGTTYRYGSRKDSRLANPAKSSQILNWMLDYVEDMHGNYMTYTYEEDDSFCLYLKEVSYGKNKYVSEGSEHKLVFSYEDRTDFIYSRMYGFDCVIKKLFKNVKSYVGTELYKEYVLTYYFNVYSKLIRIWEKTPNGIGPLYNATEITWKNAPEYEVDRYKAQVGSSRYGKSFSERQFFSADMNGDGRSDIVSLFTEGDRTIAEVFSSESSSETKFSSTASYVVPAAIDVKSYKSYQLNSMALHLEGNSRQWLAIPYLGDKQGHHLFHIYFPFSESNSDTQGWTSILQSSTEVPAYTAGDLNNDGREEFIYIEKGMKNGKYPGKIISFKVKNNRLEDANPTPEEISFQLRNKPERLIIADFNGDGFSDLLVAYEAGYKIFWNRTGKGGPIFSETDVAAYSSFNGKCTALEVGDFNGDGLPDLIVNEAYSNVWKLAINKKNGQFDMQVIPNIVAKCGNEDYFICTVNDFNNDGKSDFVITDGSLTYWCYSMASLFVVHKGNQYLPFPKSQYVSFGDFRGTGQPFFVNYGYHYGGTNWEEMSNRNLSVEDHKVRTITNGIGRQITFDYSTLGNENVYSSGASDSFEYPIVNLAVPLHVVAYTRNGGPTSIFKTFYTYGKGKIHAGGKGFLGFGEITVEENGIKTTTTSGFNAEYAAAYPTGQKQYTSGGKPINEVKFTTNFVTSDNGKHYSMQQTKKVTVDVLNGTTTTTLYSSFDKGIPRKVVTHYGNDLTETTTTTLKDDTSNGKWILGLPETVTKTVQNSQGSFTNKEKYEYNAKNQVFKNISYTGNGTEVVKTTQYTYTNSGKVESETSWSYNNNTDILTTRYEYSDDEKNLRIVTDPMGLKQEYKYDQWGRVLSHTNSKGATTSYEYNRVGNLETTKYPNYVYETVFRSFSSDSYTETVHCTGKPSESIVYDLYGREIRRTVTHFDGRKFSTETFYKQGSYLPESKSYPSSGAPTKFTRYEYDAYNRLVREYEDGGKNITYVYGKNTLSKTINGRTSTSTFNAAGRLIKVDDGGGSIVYNLRADGQPIHITPFGESKSKISFSYDKYGRQTSINDPSAGLREFLYDQWGNLREEKDPAGVTTKYTYDKFGRLLSKTLPEGVVSYGYSNYDLVSETAANSVRTWKYDFMGQLTEDSETGPNGKKLVRSYGYSGGNMNSIIYYVNGSMASWEIHDYTNGWLSKIRIKDNPNPVWQLISEDERGSVAEYSLGGGRRLCTYDNYGYLKSQQDPNNNAISRTYYFNAKDGTLTNSRVGTNSIETYRYDNLERLTHYGTTQQKQTSYDSKGNITQKEGAGVLNYTHPENPYAVMSAQFSDNKLMPHRDQRITYTSFKAPKSISENKYSAEWTYNGANARNKMVVKQDNNTILTRYYLGGQYEMDETANGTKEKLYIGGDYYSAPIVLVKENGGSWITKTIDRDYLGSVIAVNGNHYDYTPWGVLRNPATKEEYLHQNQQPELYLGRGYTGHEHLPWFGLINMNGRMYDPLLGRFLSPDPYVQAPEFSQNFNRYSYCLNNPLKYTDPSGEFVHIIIGGIIGGVVNWASHGFQFNAKGLGYFGTGALAGALGAGIGAGISSMLPVAGSASGGFAAGFLGTTAATTATSSFVSGALIGGGAGLSSGFVTGFGNALVDGQDFGQAFKQGGVYGAVSMGSGAIIGGLMSGIDAVMDGRRFWDGATVQKTTLVQQNIPIVGQIGDNDCLPASVEAVDRSFGGSITQQNVRNMPNLGGDAPLGDGDVWRAYINASGHQVNVDTNKLTSLPRVLSYMKDGQRVAVNLNTGGKVGHSVVIQSIVKKTATKINGTIYGRFLYNVMDPGNGGRIVQIGGSKITHSLNIFYIK